MVLPGRLTPRTVAFPLVILGLVAVLSASATPTDPGSKQQSLLPDQVAAIRRLSELPEGARLAVVTSETWGNDLVGEWLPALSGQSVVTTPQGSEWLGTTAFEDRRSAHNATQNCSRRTADCIASRDRDRRARSNAHRHPPRVRLWTKRAGRLLPRSHRDDSR